LYRFADSVPAGKFGLFKGRFIPGGVAQLGRVLLYRSYQSQLYGFCRGRLLWHADTTRTRIL
jgi:NADH dehydrogenase